MNLQTRTFTALAAVALILSLFSFAQSASAQSTRGVFGSRGNSAPATTKQSASRKCRNLKGIRIDVFDPAAGIAFGTITKGGILSGKTEDVINFSAGLVLTPDPNVITYLSDTTITTRRGQLRTSLVSTQNFVTGVFTQFGEINPATSTGRFAGATGVIFFDGITIGDPSIGPYKSAIGGTICLARDDDADDDEDSDSDR